MSNRVTEKELIEITGQLARVLGTEYGYDEGMLHIGMAYGGNQLVEKTKTGGQYALTSGFVPKRELYEKIQAMLQGIYLYQQWMGK